MAVNTINDDNTKLVQTGLLFTLSPVQATFYVFLVLLGILGNGTVVGVIGKSILMDQGWGQNSNIIIVNMALSNLLVSLMRNVLLMLSDMGLQIYSSKDWCQFLMAIWVWLRSVNVWSTLFLSAFHLQTLRRVAPLVGNIHGSRGAPKILLINLFLVWFMNLIYSIPAYVFSTSGNLNSTETLMVVSSTIRPLLGCIWNFPTRYSGLAFATTSLVLNETVPILLMSLANLGSLYILYTHSGMRSSVQDAPVIKRVHAEKRAAKVILALTILFIVSWGTSIISVNYFNYNRGSVAKFLLVIARFSNTTFICFSPVVLAVGHRGLRTFYKSLLAH